MNRKHRLLYEKLRFAKRKTTKREFNFMPIKQSLPKAGDVQNKDITVNEQTFALSPPKWASSPRETPATLGQQRKKKMFVDISLIEPLPGEKVPEPKQDADPDERTINLAALRAAAGHNDPKKETKEKDASDEGSDNKDIVRKKLKAKETDEKGSEKSTPSLSKVQSSEKESDSRLKEADSQPAILTTSKRKPDLPLDKDSEESVRKIWQSVRRRNNSGSTKVSRSRSSKSGSQSSGMGESENDVRKTSKSSSYKREVKEAKGSSSEGSSSRTKRSKSRNEEDEITVQENVPTRSQSRRLSERRKSGADSANSPDEAHRLRERRGSKKSSDSAEDVGFGKTSTDTVTASVSSVQRKRKVSSETKTSEGVPSKLRKSSESGKSSNNELTDIDKRSDSSAKSLTRSLATQEKRVKQSSSSEKSNTIMLTTQKKHNTRSSSSEKSTARVSTAQKNHSTRSSSSEKSNTREPTAQKKRNTRSSSSEKSTARVSMAQKKRSTRSSSSEKSNAMVSTVQKNYSTRSSSSEKSAARVSTAQKIRSTRSSSSEKSNARVSTAQKKHSTRSSSPEKSNARVSTAQKKPSTRSSSSEKSSARVSTAKKDARSSSSEKSTARISTAQNKRSSRSSSSEKITAGISTAQKTHVTKSSSPQKSVVEVSSPDRKSVGGSSNVEKSIAAQKIPVRKSSSSEKILETLSQMKKSMNREKFVPEEAQPSTSRASSHVNVESNMSAGEGSSKSEMNSPIFQGNSEKMTTAQLGDNSSSEKRSPHPDKWKLSKPQIMSEKKGAKFKKGAMPKLTKVAPAQSSAESASTDEDLFNPQKYKMSNYEILRPKGQLDKPGKLSPTKLKKSKLKNSSAKSTKSQSQKAYKMSQSRSDSDENLPPAKGTNLSSSGKKSKRRYSKDVSEEMSEVISLQDKPVIASFAGLPLLDNERDASDKSVDEEENVRLENSMRQFEEILDTNNEKLNKMYDTSRDLRLNLLQPRKDENESIPSRSANFVTDLDVLWNFVEKSLSMIIKEADDEEHKSLIKSMRSYLGKYFSNAIHERLNQKEMITSLNRKSRMINALTSEMLRLKQENRQLAKNLYEKEAHNSPEKNDEILIEFENFSKTFTQFKRN